MVVIINIFKVNFYHDQRLNCRFLRLTSNFWPLYRERLLNPTETLLQNPPYCDETKLGFKKLTSRGFVSFPRFHYGFLRADYARGLVQDICK